MRIVFHGESASAYIDGFGDLLDAPADIVALPDVLATDAARQTYASADVIIGFRFNATLPRPEALRLFHIAGAGYDAIDFAALPPSAVVCNCFQHEQPIAEYVMSALLMRHVPLADADRLLRSGIWSYRAGPIASTHDELAGKTMGVLGFGRIGRAVARRAKAFDMVVHAANRSPLAASPIADRAFGFDRLHEFWGSADFIVVALPLAEGTRHIVDAGAFAAMRPTAVVVNVDRGATIDERALFDALRTGRIAGAVIDTWYTYPSPGSPTVHPSSLPFHELPNVLMTPHMSGWTRGTIRRRQHDIADNVRRRLRGEPCVNVVWPA